MKTYKEILAKFQTAQQYHTFLNSFGHGGLDKLNDAGSQLYPLMFIRPINSLGIQPYGQRTLTLECYILDLPKLDRTLDIQCMSDCERAAYDVYAYFRDGTDQQSYEINMTGIAPITEAFQDRVMGWVTTMDIITDTSGISYCKIPTDV